MRLGSAVHYPSFQLRNRRARSVLLTRRVGAGGPVSGSVSAGRIRLWGDSVALRKVQGLDVRLVADGGDVTADAVYARRFRASPGARQCRPGGWTCLHVVSDLDQI